MRSKILDLVVCPECKGELHLEILTGDALVLITEGVLTCSKCERRYPVIDGIPRLLPDKLIGNLLVYHEEFFNKYRTIFKVISANPVDDQEVLLKQKTIRSFSFQWNTFGEIFQEYRQHWNDYLPDSLGEPYFKGKLGLDAGCGFGRHILQASEAGAEMVGVDLSEAVVAAHKNTMHLPNIHIIQGDIYALPFRGGTFDFIYSLGVLHHLPDPQGGFNSIAALLAPEQEIFVWCYDNEKPQKNSMYEFIRRFTTRLDFRILYLLTFMAALGVRITLNYPAMLLRNLRIYRKFPYDYYCKYPLRVLHADLFDVFSVPSTKYYDQNGLEDWFRKSGLHIEEGKHSISGWTIYGKKNG